jgi:hypothetical protein
VSRDLESRLDSALKAGDAADRFAQPGSTYELGIAIAQLRHAYKQIVNSEVNDWQSFAKWLLAPQIERLELYHQALSHTVAPQGERASIVRYLRHVARVEVGTLLGIFGPQARELTDTIAGWVESRLDDKWTARADATVAKAECFGCAIERKQRDAVAERKRTLDAALGRDEPVRVTIDICPVHSIPAEETKDDCAGCVHRDEALRNATHRGDILHMALAAIFIESNTGSGLVEAAESRERMRALAREAIER